MTVRQRLAANYESVCQRVRQACHRSGRSPDAVLIVAVTKYADWQFVREVIPLGVVDLGESRPQQLVERAALLTEPGAVEKIRWHLIGHLQRNKVRRVLPLVSLIHSVDSWRLLEALEREAAEQDLRPQVLLEINVTGEASKQGLTPEAALEGWPRALAGGCRVGVRGLMTMAQENADPEVARPTFKALRGLRDRLRSMASEFDPASTAAGWYLDELSMGMTADFEVAIEEGATLVRIGSALFEGVGERGT